MILRLAGPTAMQFGIDKFSFTNSRGQEMVANLKTHTAYYAAVEIVLKGFNCRVNAPAVPFYIDCSNRFIFPSGLLGSLKKVWNENSSRYPAHGELATLEEDCEAICPSKSKWALYATSRHVTKLAGDLLFRGISHYQLVVNYRFRRRGRTCETCSPQLRVYLLIRGCNPDPLAALPTNRIVGTVPEVCNRQLVNQLQALGELIRERIPQKIEAHFRPGQKVRVKDICASRNNWHRFRQVV